MNTETTPTEGSLVVSRWSERSESIAKIAAALSKFQGEIANVKKDSANPFFKSKYADLGAVWDVIRPHLAANGLSVLQEPGTHENRVILATTLLHSSGEYLRSTLTFPVTKADPQGYGSAITYARRYALQAVTGIAPEDDDGNAASGRDGESPKPPTKPAKRPEAFKAAEEQDQRGDSQVRGATALYRYDVAGSQKKDQAELLLQKAGAAWSDDDLCWLSPREIKPLEKYLKGGAQA